MRRGSGSLRSPIIVSDDEDENAVRIQHEEQFREAAAIATQLESHSYSKSQETLFHMGYIQEQGFNVEIDDKLSPVAVPLKRKRRSESSSAAPAPIIAKAKTRALPPLKIEASATPKSLRQPKRKKPNSSPESIAPALNASSSSTRGDSRASVRGDFAVKDNNLVRSLDPPETYQNHQNHPSGFCADYAYFPPSLGLPFLPNDQGFPIPGPFLAFQSAHEDPFPSHLLPVPVLDSNPMSLSSTPVTLSSLSRIPTLGVPRDPNTLDVTTHGIFQCQHHQPVPNHTLVFECVPRQFRDKTFIQDVCRPYVPAHVEFQRGTVLVEFANAETAATIFNRPRLKGTAGQSGVRAWWYEGEKIRSGHNIGKSKSTQNRPKVQRGPDGNKCRPRPTREVPVKEDNPRSTDAPIEPPRLSEAHSAIHQGRTPSEAPEFAKISSQAVKSVTASSRQQAPFGLGSDASRISHPIPNTTTSELSSRLPCGTEHQTNGSGGSASSADIAPNPSPKIHERQATNLSGEFSSKHALLARTKDLAEQIARTRKELATHHQAPLASGPPRIAETNGEYLPDSQLGVQPENSREPLSTGGLVETSQHPHGPTPFGAAPNASTVTLDSPADSTSHPRAATEANIALGDVTSQLVDEVEQVRPPDQPRIDYQFRPAFKLKLAARQKKLEEHIEVAKMLMKRLAFAQGKQEREELLAALRECNRLMDEDKSGSLLKIDAHTPMRQGNHCGLFRWPQSRDEFGVLVISDDEDE